MQKNKKLILISISILILLASISTLIYIVKSNKKSSIASTNTNSIDKSTDSKDKTTNPNEKDSSSNKEKEVKKTSSPSPSSNNNKNLQGTLINMKAPQSQKWGNTLGNIYNEGVFAFHDGYLYFFNETILINDLQQASPNIIRTKEDGITALTKLKINSTPTYFNVVGEWIYFCSKDSGALCRLKLNGTELELLDVSYTKNLIIFDNTLFYIQNGSLYRSSIDNFQEKKLLAENVSYFTLSEDGKTIFYCPNTTITLDNQTMYPGTTSIYSMETSGENLKHIFTIDSESNLASLENILVYKNYIYFRPKEWYIVEDAPWITNYIARLDYTSSNPTVERYVELSSIEDMMGLCDGYLYYTIINHDTVSTIIYRRNLHDNSIESLTIDGVEYITTGLYCFGEKVYFVAGRSYFSAFSDPFSLYCLDFENKSAKRIESVVNLSEINWQTEID